MIAWILAAAILGAGVYVFFRSKSTDIESRLAAEQQKGREETVTFSAEEVGKIGRLQGEAARLKTLQQGATLGVVVLVFVFGFYYENRASELQEEANAAYATGWETSWGEACRTIFTSEFWPGDTLYYQGVAYNTAWCIGLDQGANSPGFAPQTTIDVEGARSWDEATAWSEVWPTVKSNVPMLCYADYCNDFEY